MRGEPYGCNDYIICTLRAAVQHPASAGCRIALRGELAGFDDCIICILQAAARHPASVGWRAAMLGEFAGFDDCIICTLRAAARLLQSGVGWWRAGRLPTPMSAPSALCGPPPGIRLEPVTGWRRAGSSFPGHPHARLSSARSWYPSDSI